MTTNEKRFYTAARDNLLNIYFNRLSLHSSKRYRMPYVNDD